jgi:ABC-type multidrug transport system permease subunit
VRRNTRSFAPLRRLLALLHARNLEFVRDRKTLGWNLLMPFGIVFAFAFIFSGPDKPLFKVGVLTPQGVTLAQAKAAQLHPLLGTRFVDFYAPDNADAAVRKLARHQVDLLLDLRSTVSDKPVIADTTATTTVVGPLATSVALAPAHYWVNPDSPKGYITEQLLRLNDRTAIRNTVTGKAVSYVDWVLPGILGLNLMFSSVFGAGYVIVRYRKSGYLRRLRATPLTAFEFLSAQVLSRLLLVMTIAMLVFVPLTWIVGLHVAGSGLLLFALAALGALSLISLGLVVAAYVSSEELAGGLLNLCTWPMMLLSGVWYSLEGASPWLQRVAQALPLTHLLEGARAIMIDGAGIADIWPHMAILAGMVLVFLSVSAVGFKWRVE